MNQHDTPAKVASTDGLGPLVADALTADKGKLHCTRLRAYVQSYGICDEYVPPPVQKRG